MTIDSNIEISVSPDEATVSIRRTESELSHGFVSAIREGVPSCAACRFSRGVPDGEAGGERHVYCARSTSPANPRGEKIRRTERCENFELDEITAQELVRLLAEKLLGKD